MKMLFKEVNGDEEAMRFIILADDDGVEIKKFPIYINKEMTTKLPILSETYSTLPELFKMVYQSGINNEDIEFIYDVEYYQLTFPEKTDKKIVAMLNKIGDKSVNKIYTFYLHTTDISDRLSDVYLYNITGVKEQELPLLAPISMVYFDAKEGLASIGELVLEK